LSPLNSIQAAAIRQARYAVGRTVSLLLELGCEVNRGECVFCGARLRRTGPRERIQCGSSECTSAYWRLIAIGRRRRAKK
jgi:hypothetical protein